LEEALVGLTDYLKIIRTRLWLIVLSMVVVLGVVLALSLLQSPTYRGHAEVIVSAPNAGAILLGASRNYASDEAVQADVQTQVRVVQSRGLAEQVIRTLDLNTTPDSLLQRVTASNDGQTNVVTIDAVDGSAPRAADIANAFAEAYVAWSRDSRQANIKAAGDDVEQRLSLAQQQIAALASAAGGASVDQQVKLQAARELYASLADKLEQLRVNQLLEVGSGSVLTNAVADPVPVSPRPARDGGLGLAVGLALGLGMVVLVEQLDTRIRSSEEAEEIYDAPVLGNIPVETFKKKETSRLTLLQRPESPAADAYRGLRINLNFINYESHIKTVLVTSAAPSEGKSTVAANLAIALSQAGQRVVLLNCDFHRPPGATFFECVDGHIGLSDLLLTGEREIDAFQQPEALERLVVVAAGSAPPNPSDLLGSSRMQELIAALRESMDWVIMDAPPLLAVADAAALARWADGVLIVTHIGASTRGAARTARDQLEKIGARILGISVWGLRNSTTARAYSGYYASP
jgi:polysaccharide biosynthesis transport protein